MGSQAERNPMVNAWTVVGVACVAHDGGGVPWRRSCKGSQRRGEWLVKWVSEVATAAWMCSGRDFAETLGRLSFVAQVLLWAKPFLAPMFARSAVVSKGAVCKVPALVHIALRAGQHLKLRWRPREENVLADKLTNVRIPLKLEKVPLALFHSLCVEWEAFKTERAVQKEISKNEPKQSRKKLRKEKRPWG